MEFSIENQLLAILTMCLTEAMALFLYIMRESETGVFILGNITCKNIVAIKWYTNCMPLYS